MRKIYSNRMSEEQFSFNLEEQKSTFYIVFELQLPSYKWAAAEVVAPDSWSKSDLVRGVCPNPRHNWSQCPRQHCSSVSQSAEEKLKLVTRDQTLFPS